jgi:hypothetical protein
MTIPVYKDRVQETTTTTGTGTVTLAGAVSGPWQSAATAYAANPTTYVAYAIYGTTVWEVGEGTYTLSGTTLTRTLVRDGSSGPGALVTLAGTSTVFVTLPAARVADAEAVGAQAMALGIALRCGNVNP